MVDCLHFQVYTWLWLWRATDRMLELNVCCVLCAANVYSGKHNNNNKQTKKAKIKNETKVSRGRATTNKIKINGK